MSARRSATARCLVAMLAACSVCHILAAEMGIPDPQQFASSSHSWAALSSPVILPDSAESSRQTGFVALAISTDGSMIATVDRKSTIRLYDTTDIQLLRTFEASKQNVSNLTFSPDGSRLVTVGLDAAITIWNVASGTRESEVLGASGWILGVAFAPSGKFFVTGGYHRRLQVWEPTAAKELHSLDSESAIRDLAFSNDGTRLLAGCVDGQVRAWQTNDWTRTSEPPRLSVPVNAVAFSPDGSCFAGGGDGGQIRFWDAADCHELAALTFQFSQIMKLVFAPQGKTLFSCAANGDIAVWDVAQRRLLQGFSQHRDEATGLAWLPGHRAIVTVGGDGKKLVRYAQIPPANVKALGETVATWTALSRDGQLLIDTDGKTEIRLTDLNRDNSAQTITTVATRCMTVTASNHLLAAGIDRRLREWDLMTASFINESPPLNEEIECMDGANDGRRLVVGTTNRLIQLVDVSQVSNPIVRWSTPAQPLSLSCVAFSPDDKIIATATRDPLNWRAEGEVKLWDSETGVEMANLGLHSAEVLGLCFDATGQRLATFGSFYDVRLWDIATRKELPRLPTRANVVGAAFTQDGKRIILAQNNGPVALWSIQRQMPTHELVGHNKTVAALISSRDRKLVVTRDVINHAKIWKVPDE